MIREWVCTYMDLTKLTPAPWGHYHPSELPKDIRFAWGVGVGETGGYLFRLTSSHDPKLSGGGGGGHNPPKDVDAAFISLARNAFDVMMRRGWGAASVNYEEGQAPRFGIVWGTLGGVSKGAKFWEDVNPLCSMHWPDPFTALVEADRWYVEHVEKPQ